MLALRAVAIRAVWAGCTSLSRGRVIEEGAAVRLPLFFSRHGGGKPIERVEGSAGKMGVVSSRRPDFSISPFAEQAVAFAPPR